MTRVCVEIGGNVDEVVRVLWDLGNAGSRATVGDAGGSLETPCGGGADATPAAGTQGAAGSDEPAAGEWTEALAGEYLAGLDAAARGLARHVWRAGEAGIHRSALCQRTELTPGELRALLMRMGHGLRRLRRERGLARPRPVAANSPLQSYFVDPGFAAAARSGMFDERTSQQLADGGGASGSRRNCRFSRIPPILTPGNEEHRHAAAYRCQPHPHLPPPLPLSFPTSYAPAVLKASAGSPAGSAAAVSARLLRRAAPTWPSARTATGSPEISTPASGPFSGAGSAGRN